MCNLEIDTNQHDPKQELQFQPMNFLLNDRELFLALKLANQHGNKFHFIFGLKINRKNGCQLSHDHNKYIKWFYIENVECKLRKV